jgi:hypothetical protein
VRFACKEAALTEADEEAILIEAICSAFPLGQPPCPLFRKGAPSDDIYTDIDEAFGSKKWYYGYYGDTLLYPLFLCLRSSLFRARISECVPCQSIQEGRASERQRRTTKLNMRRFGVE